MAEAPPRDVVCLVDRFGHVTGEMAKRDAHLPPGALHLAISVVLYRFDGALLLQQRAPTKYHFPLVWANACCSHPQPGERVADAAAMRVEEELGVRVELFEAGSFVYRATCAKTGLVEHEFDHVFVGRLDALPRPDPAEVAAVQFVAVADVLASNIDGALAPWVHEVVQLAERARPFGSQSDT